MSFGTPCALQKERRPLSRPLYLSIRNPADPAYLVEFSVRIGTTQEPPRAITDSQYLSFWNILNRV